MTSHLMKAGNDIRHTLFGAFSPTQNVTSKLRGSLERVTYANLFPALLYTQSVLIRNGPIRSTSEILAFFKKSPVELSKLRNGEITFQIFKKCTSESFQFKKWSRIPVSRSIS